MQDWEAYYGRSSSTQDDPWDSAAPARRRGGSRTPESHDPEPDHGIGSCDPASPHSPRPRAKSHRLAGALIVLAVVIAVAVASTLFNLLYTDETTAAPEPADHYSGDDSFSVDVDPDSGGESDDPSAPADTMEQTGPSQVEPYTGGASLTLELHSARDLEALTYQEIYARVAPSVVTITVYGDYTGAYATGIILSEDGYILTNQHVVACQSYAQVTTVDNVTYDALLVGEDPNSDLALLKVEAEGLVPAEFGDSAELLVGDECFAIGNPLGINYRGTFSNGIISALNRNVNMNDYTMTLIQTTAALNSGNSGGPLINIYGQVIGVNNMKIMSSSTTVEGLGFAIPSSTVQRVTNTLAADGVVEHPVIGITCYGVTAGGPEGLAVDGILVVTVNSASDAYAQGLREGDVITALNGQSVCQVSDVDLSGMHVGDTLTLTVWREGEGIFDLEVALVEQNDLN